jgi:hypothetical protein
MRFIPFDSLFPEVAKKETRTLLVERSPDGLPRDEYAFLEMYCDERGCDCRRVFFTVFSETKMRPLAVIAWGWESLKFYRKWAPYDPDPELVQELKGPVLNMGSPQSVYAPALLDLCREVLLADPQYVERIKRHYAMFREKIDHPNRPAPVPLERELASIREQVAATRQELDALPRKESAMVKQKSAILMKKEVLLKKKMASLKKKSRVIAR